MRHIKVEMILSVPDDVTQDSVDDQLILFAQKNGWNISLTMTKDVTDKAAGVKKERKKKL